MPSSKLGQSSITVRCTQAEHDIIAQNAAKMNMKLSEYVRFVAVHVEIKVEIKGE